jgi:hypothetical protein
VPVPQNKSDMQAQNKKAELINKILAAVKAMYILQEITWKEDKAKNKGTTWKKDNYIPLEDMFLSLIFKNEEELQQLWNVIQNKTSCVKH